MPTDAPAAAKAESMQNHSAEWPLDQKFFRAANHAKTFIGRARNALKPLIELDEE